jgi:hypothetical protein
MRHGIAAVFGVVLLASLCMPAVAQWKWRDKNGQTQYSDLPPPQGTPESSILQRPAGAKPRIALPADGDTAAPVASAPGLPAPKLVDPELQARLRKEEQDKAAKSKQEADKIAAQKAENCARARSHMRLLDDGVRIVRSNEKGEREVLDDKTRAEETSRTKAVIASDCN